MSEWLPGTDDVTSPWYPWADEETWLRAKELGSPPALPDDDVADRVKEVLAQTEVIHLGPGHDFVYTPDMGWDLHGTLDNVVFTRAIKGGSITWEVECSEEKFWDLCAMFLGPQEVVEMKDYVSALADWEGDGGSCLVD